MYGPSNPRSLVAFPVLNLLVKRRTTGGSAGSRAKADSPARAPDTTGSGQSPVWERSRVRVGGGGVHEMMA